MHVAILKDRSSTPRSDEPNIYRHSQPLTSFIVRNSSSSISHSQSPSRCAPFPSFLSTHESRRNETTPPTWTAFQAPLLPPHVKILPASPWALIPTCHPFLVSQRGRVTAQPANAVSDLRLLTSSYLQLSNDLSQVNGSTRQLPAQPKVAHSSSTQPQAQGLEWTDQAAGAAIPLTLSSDYGPQRELDLLGPADFDNTMRWPGGTTFFPADELETPNSMVANDFSGFGSLSDGGQFWAGATASQFDPSQATIPSADEHVHRGKKRQLDDPTTQDSSGEFSRGFSYSGADSAHSSPLPKRKRPLIQSMIYTTSLVCSKADAAISETNIAVNRHNTPKSSPSPSRNEMISDNEPWAHSGKSRLSR